MQRKCKHSKSGYVAKYCCLVFTFSAIALLSESCKKFIETKAPVTTLTDENVYSTDAGAISVLTGMYYQVSSSNAITGGTGISAIAGLYSDEFSLSSAVSIADSKYFAYNDSLFSNINGSQGTQFWSPYYNFIFRCNAAIEGLSNSGGVTGSVKKQLLGEAKFTRALFYFYLTNLYGDLPLALTTDWKVNNALTRSSQQLVYQQIVSDLKEAQQLLSDVFLDGYLKPYGSPSATERVRPTKWAATALLARVYLYNQDWANAEAQSTSLIANSLFDLPSLSAAFLKNSSETIWQLQPPGFGQNTFEGAFFILPSAGPNSSFPVYLSSQLLSSFESGDQRRYNRKWVDSVKVGTNIYYFPYKYKVPKDATITQPSQITEYQTVFRLGEQFLIRAEARAQLNNIPGAQADLGSIRTRAGLPAIVANDKNSLLAAIMHERQVELFSEWGQRWFDLKRTGTADAVMTVVRPSKTNGRPWNSDMKLFPILYADILRNLNLTQNPGYQ